MSQVSASDFPDGPSNLTYAFAEQVNQVGRTIPDGVLIEDLLHYEKHTVPVWTAFLTEIDDEHKVDAICSVLRYVVHDHHFFPGMTVGKLRGMSYEELCSTKIVNQRAAFLINAFRKG